jgi:hypothetical protein
MALSFPELTSQRPLFEICDGVIACVFLCYTHSLFVEANPVLCYFLSMLRGALCVCGQPYETGNVLTS